MMFERTLKDSRGFVYERRLYELVPPRSGVLELFGMISRHEHEEGITAADFGRALDALGDVEEIDLLVNSGGGCARTMFKMYDMLEAHHARVSATIVRDCGSAAADIVMVADRIRIVSGSTMFLHNSDIPTINALCAARMARRTGNALSDIETWCAAETHFTAYEAYQCGLADEYLPGLKQ